MSHPTDAQQFDNERRMMIARSFSDRAEDSSLIRSIKVTFIGPSGEGKTCLMHQMYHMGVMSKNIKPNFEICKKSTTTIGGDFKVYNYMHFDKEFRMHLWDTAGQERFQSITTTYLRNTEWFVIAVSLPRLAEDLLDLHTKSMIAAATNTTVDKIKLEQVWEKVMPKTLETISVARKQMEIDNVALGLSVCLTKIDAVDVGILIDVKDEVREARLFARDQMVALCARERLELYGTSALTGSGVSEFMTYMTTTAATRKLQREVANVSKDNVTVNTTVTVSLTPPASSAPVPTQQSCGSC